MTPNWNLPLKNLEVRTGANKWIFVRELSCDDGSEFVDIRNFKLYEPHIEPRALPEGVLMRKEVFLRKILPVLNEWYKA